MEKIKNYIIKNNLIAEGETIGVGVSGGSDSMFLLSILLNLKEELNFEVIAIHINHGVRDDALKDAAFVMEECDKLGVRAYKFKIDGNKIAKDKSQSLESACRIGRYDVFNSLIQKGVVDKIALAHHKSDQAESVLMHLFRGAGTQGAKGMSPIRDGIYIRPILDVTKAEIYNYLLENQVEYITDYSNFDNKFNRNFIRNEIIPQLAKRWPNVENAIINFAKNISDEDEYLNTLVDDNGVIYEEKLAKIPVSYFIYNTPILNRLLFVCLKNIGINQDIESKHIELIKKLALNGESGKKIDLPNGLIAVKEYEFVTLANKEYLPLTFEYPLFIGETKINNFGKILIKKESIFEKNNEKLFFDLSKIPNNAVWRLKKDGDMFEKFGGGSKPLNKYLIDKKIPLRERQTLPVLATGNEVLIIPNIEISNKIKVEKNSIICSIKIIKN